MMKNQRGDTEKKLIKNSKNVGIHKIIKQTGKINSKLKSLVQAHYKAILSYYSKGKKTKRVKTKKVAKNTHRKYDAFIKICVL